ncbi:MAG: response regulator transcription factor [Cyanobacteria bacterium P01_F01_bin.143]
MLDTKSKILIIDDHRLLLNGVIELVRDRFPQAQIFSANTIQEAASQITENLPHLVIADLSLPQTKGATANIENGLEFLRSLMGKYYDLNIMVQTSHPKALVRLIPEIDNHHGGFTIADKSLPIEALLTFMEWAMLGITYTKNIQIDLEVKPEWLEVLRLAFEEGLQDKAIAQSMYVSERMIRHYWSKIKNALEIYPEPGQNMRALIQIRAREYGLIN